MAWLSLDQGRIERNQHGLIPCITVHDTEQAVASRATVLGERTMNFYSDLFKYWPFKVRVRVRSFMGLFLYRPFIVEVLVLLISGGLLSVGGILQEIVDVGEILPRTGHHFSALSGRFDHLLVLLDHPGAPSGLFGNTGFC